MQEIIWNDDYSVGVQQLDEQHKKIISFINRLVNDTNLSVYSESLNEALTEMLKYSIEHLRYEENLLKENDYPDFDSHKQFHEDYIKRSSEFSISAMDSDYRVPTEVISYLRDWWEHHILEEDMKYKEFFKAKGIN